MPNDPALSSYIPIKGLFVGNCHCAICSRFMLWFLLHHWGTQSQATTLSNWDYRWNLKSLSLMYPLPNLGTLGPSMPHPCMSTETLHSQKFTSEASPGDPRTCFWALSLSVGTGSKPRTVPLATLGHISGLGWAQPLASWDLLLPQCGQAHSLLYPKWVSWAPCYWYSGLDLPQSLTLQLLPFV